ncbi:ankyrin repeat domain-containing protein [Actinomadura viridis]|uniref:ankyrin repeat domain-containing protein n=1 Tax=Actinomadura viridis TaxID=58110 RepID=UPI0036967224
MPQGSTAAPPQGAGLGPGHLARLRRLRRHAVPRWMIEQATERRLAGDWRGACAAAGMEVTFDLSEVADRYGAEVAAALEDDLRHLVPDLVRWHAPRVGSTGRTTMAPDHVLTLEGYGTAPRDSAWLYVTTQPYKMNGPQRLRLRFGELSARNEAHIDTDYPHTSFWAGLVHSWTAARHLWDARRTAELHERCGGNGRRVPFLDPGGTPRDAGLLPASDPGRADPAAHAEWVTLLHGQGEVEAAFAAAGVELVPPGPESERFREYYTVGPLDQLARMPLALTRLEPEIRRMGGGRFHIPWTQHAAVLLDHDGERLRVEVVEYDSYYEAEELEGVDVLAEALWRRLPDLDLLRDGRTPPERLHPLVHDALFPGRTAGGAPFGPPGPEPFSPVRVRCRGEWHEVVFRDGVLEIPHSAQEQERERALQALGGDVGGCVAVRRAWTTGKGRLPRALRERRREVFDRAHHGDTAGVLRMLELGMDPRVRDDWERTLLHLLHLVDHRRLLPLLLAAGLDLEARDQTGRTPLFVAVAMDGSLDLISALLDAGARIDVVDEEETTLYHLIQRVPRDDLEFLEKRIEEEYPETADY